MLLGYKKQLREGDCLRVPGLLSRSSPSGTRLDRLAVVVPHVGHGLQSLHPQHVFGSDGLSAEVSRVSRGVGNLVFQDEFVHGVDGHLGVLGHVGGPAFLPNGYYGPFVST